MDKTRKNERALEHEAAVAEVDNTATGIDEPAAPAAGTLNAALLNPKADIAVLDALENELFALGYALGEIISFADVIDPDGATEDRGEALAYLVQKRQEALCAPEIGARVVLD